MVKAKAATETETGQTKDGEETIRTGTSEQVTNAGMGIPRDQPTVDDPQRKTDANSILATDPRTNA